MKKNFFYSMIFSALFLCTSLSAALSPLNQSVKEVQEIISSKKFEKAFTQEDPIESIVHLENGYLISTKTQELMVEVEYDNSPHIGPIKYRLIFQETKPRMSPLPAE